MAVFTLNVSGNPAIDIFVVSVVVLLLILLNLGQGGVYKQNILTALEMFYVVNLGLLAAATALVRQIEGKQQPAIIYTSNATALVTFIGTLVYHMKVQLLKWYSQWNKHTEERNTTTLQLCTDYESTDGNAVRNHPYVPTTVVTIETE